MSITKIGAPLQSLADWERLAGPKRSMQWADGRSAKESARAWLECGGKVPTEIASALAGHPDFGPILSWSAEPEAKLAFDELRGETRNSDMILLARDSRGEFVVGIEAKADETFDATVERTLIKAFGRFVQNNRSKGLERLQMLVQAVLGELDDARTVQSIRYQLLAATAGVICEAERRGSSRAVLLVHEFKSDKTADTKHQANAADLNRFVDCVSRGSVAELPAGKLVGPFNLPGATLFSARTQLYVAKAARDIRTAPALTSGVPA